MHTQLSFTQPAPIYNRLRQAILSLDPAELGLSQSTSTGPVWGFMMETGYSVGTTTLVVLRDGTTSLYFSNGGGFIGCGRHPGVQQASQDLIEAAEKAIPRMKKVDSCVLPAPNRVHFHALTQTGLFSLDCSTAELSSSGHACAELYQSSQGVITQIRLLDEARRKNSQDV